MDGYGSVEIVPVSRADSARGWLCGWINQDVVAESDEGLVQELLQERDKLFRCRRY